MMNIWRRMLCKGLGVLPVLGSLTACAQPNPSDTSGIPKPPAGRSWSPEELERMHRFRGVRGYELFVSGFGSNSKEGVFARLFDDRSIPLDSGYFWDKGDSKSTFTIYPPGLMKTLHAKVYVDRDKALLYDVTIPVADRIPDELLDEIRRRGGNLRIKIRLHRDGVLLGWDIERRPGFDRKKRDSYGAIAYVPPGWVKTGGDFKEARGVYWLEDESGNLVRPPSPESLGGVMPPELTRRGIVFRNGFLREKGWYIHPKTGERIETDF